MSKDSQRDVRISEISPLRSPDQLSYQLPLSQEDKDLIREIFDEMEKDK